MTIDSVQMQLAAAASAKARYRRSRSYLVGGWTSNDRMEFSSDPVPFRGTANVAFVVGLMFYYGGGTNQRLVEHRDGSNRGWWLFVDSNARVHFRVYDGSGFAGITSATLTAGKVYVVCANYNSSYLLLTVNNANSTAVGPNRDFTPSSVRAGLGASIGLYNGNSPATNQYIIGVTFKDQSALTSTQRSNWIADCQSVNDVVVLPEGSDNLYSAKKGDLAKDQIGGADWSVIGTGLFRSSLKPSYGVL